MTLLATFLSRNITICFIAEARNHLLLPTSNQSSNPIQSSFQMSLLMHSLFIPSTTVFKLLLKCPVITVVALGGPISLAAPLGPRLLRKSELLCSVIVSVSPWAGLSVSPAASPPAALPVRCRGRWQLTPITPDSSLCPSKCTSSPLQIEYLVGKCKFENINYSLY